ncbi:hypothetical protein ACRN9J_02655 [Shewanella baltica]|uniref:Uncharacterized protein n=1 Tax=Shewanella baltica (strain OS195) TaxID=399599 RepID=A9L4M8_SHEB9|nr:hypothetical protein [Shewanella baltica]ABX51144.1 conserved hypothetical protein [Shewanella baltica OS195]ADT96145.1 hypothetical protein Sbal678_4015 [Shewanella baltica OS678]EHC08201.1 hypothetical protein Sbal625DRAFT_0533 [Shewanella baltica OS625]
MNIPVKFTQGKCVQSQSHGVLKRPLKCLVLSLAVGISLLGALSVSTAAVAGHRDHSEQGERQGHRDSHSRGESHYNNRHDNHYDNRHVRNDNRHYRPYYRPYYPWGLGLGLGLATGWGSGWNVGYGVNSQWNNDWGWNTSRDAYARNYWNSPYSGIGLSIPMRYDDEPVAISTPVRVTTSMQYSASEGRMVSSMPVNMAGQSTGQLVSQASNAASKTAATPRPRAAHSVSSLPSNARIVQQDGRTLYEWQGTLYAFDWNSQTYQEQLAR